MRWMFWTAIAACTPHLTSPNGAGAEWTAPENSWPVSPPPATLDAEGFDEGEVVPDFLLNDQFGDPVSLWQFYGQVVVLDISTIWCQPCQQLAMGVEETSQDYADEGFVYLTVLAEDVTGGVADQAELNSWVDMFELTSPVISDPDKDYSSRAGVNGTYPLVLVLDREMRVEARLGPDEPAIRAAIEDVL